MSSIINLWCSKSPGVILWWSDGGFFSVPLSPPPATSILLLPTFPYITSTTPRDGPWTRSFQSNVGRVNDIKRLRPPPQNPKVTRRRDAFRPISLLLPASLLFSDGLNVRANCLYEWYQAALKLVEIFKYDVTSFDWSVIHINDKYASTKTATGYYN